MIDYQTLKTHGDKSTHYNVSRHHLNMSSLIQFNLKCNTGTIVTTMESKELDPFYQIKLVMLIFKYQI